MPVEASAAKNCPSLPIRCALILFETRMYNKNSGHAPSLANDCLFVLYSIAASNATAGLGLVSFEHGNLYAGC